MCSGRLFFMMKMSFFNIGESFYTIWDILAAKRFGKMNESGFFMSSRMGQEYQQM